MGGLYFTRTLLLAKAEKEWVILDWNILWRLRLRRAGSYFTRTSFGAMVVDGLDIF